MRHLALEGPFASLPSEAVWRAREVWPQPSGGREASAAFAGDELIFGGAFGFDDPGAEGPEDFGDGEAWPERATRPRLVLCLVGFLQLQADR